MGFFTVIVDSSSRHPFIPIVQCCHIRIYTHIQKVKSLRAVSLDSAELDPKGLKGDRRFMVVSPLPTPLWGSFGPNESTHRFLTQRQCPSLATIIAKLEDDGYLTLSCAGSNNKKSIRIQTQPPNPTTTYKAGIWSDQVLVDDMGDEAAAFFQSIIDSDPDCKSGDEGDKDASSPSMYNNVRLVSHTRNDRLADRQFVPSVARSWITDSSPPVALSDGFPILIACQASLDELNRRLVESGKKAIPMSRFRPNIVIQGSSLEPFEEDRWKVISIGDALFTVVKACPRCKQSCTDQETGKVSNEPIETMSTFRAIGPDVSDVFFAQNVVPITTTGTIQKGAPVRVLERGDPVYAAA